MRSATVNVPTWRGWLVLGVLGVVFLVLVVHGIHPFLAPTDPKGEGYLVVEGWLHDDAVPVVLSWFGRGKYQSIVTTGGNLSRGSLLVDYGSFAKLAAETLIRAGVPSELVKPVPAQAVFRNRTYSSAVAVRNWLSHAGVVGARLDVVTSGPHARRSRLLFEMALGADVDVGIIALPPTAYDQDAWWRTSSGVRTVIGETIAYLYAKILFWP